MPLSDSAAATPTELVASVYQAYCDTERLRMTTIPAAKISTCDTDCSSVVPASALRELSRRGPSAARLLRLDHQGARRFEIVLGLALQAVGEQLRRSRLPLGQARAHVDEPDLRQQLFEVREGQNGDVLAPAEDEVLEAPADAPESWLCTR